MQATTTGTVLLPTRLNNVPHQREVRQFFYKDATEAILAAVRAGEKRIRTRHVPPAQQFSTISNSCWRCSAGPTNVQVYHS